MQEPFFQLHTYNNSGGCTIQIRAASDAFVSFDAPQPRTCVGAEAAASSVRGKALQESCRAGPTRTPITPLACSPRSPPSLTSRCRHHYHLQLFEACLRAMASADQTYIRLNGAGMCSMVHKVLTDAGACYVWHAACGAWSDRW